jgi:hypothetical protein
VAQCFIEQKDFGVFSFSYLLEKTWGFAPGFFILGQGRSRPANHCPDKAEAPRLAATLGLFFWSSKLFEAALAVRVGSGSLATVRWLVGQGAQMGWPPKKVTPRALVHR